MQKSKSGKITLPDFHPLLKNMNATASTNILNQTASITALFRTADQDVFARWA
jgi:hypothetical protein